MSSTTPLVLLSAHHIHVPSSSSSLTSLSTSSAVPVSPGRPLLEQYPAEGEPTTLYGSGPSMTQSPLVSRVLDPVTTRTGETSGAYLQVCRRDRSPHHSVSLAGPSRGHINTSRADPMERPDGCFVCRTPSPTTGEANLVADTPPLPRSGSVTMPTPRPPHSLLLHCPLRSFLIVPPFPFVFHSGTGWNLQFPAWGHGLAELTTGSQTAWFFQASPRAPPDDMEPEHQPPPSRPHPPLRSLTVRRSH